MKMIEFRIDFLWQGEECLALALTDGEKVKVLEILDSDGEVPVELDWDMIQTIETLARCFWMDEQATFYFSSEEH